MIYLLIKNIIMGGIYTLILICPTSENMFEK